MISTILFDLDGTLLPMDQELFIKTYFQALATRFAPLGYDPRKLIDSVWKGTQAMVKNTSTDTNETVFWNTFADLFGEQIRGDIPVFEDFYRKEFQHAQAVCGCNPKTKEAVHFARFLGFRVILATNPLFPSIATESRIRWAGLEPEDFEFYTTYENSRRCKPNPDYFREILERANLRPEECLMVGNDTSEDLAATALGIRVFFLTDCLINRDSLDLAQYPHGGFDELMDYLAGLRSASKHHPEA